MMNVCKYIMMVINVCPIHAICRNIFTSICVSIWKKYRHFKVLIRKGGELIRFVRIGINVEHFERPLNKPKHWSVNRLVTLEYRQEHSVCTMMVIHKRGADEVIECRVIRDHHNNNVELRLYD